MRAPGMVLLLLVLPALGQTAPAEPDTPGQAADRVLAALDARDRETLKSLAERDEPDPWLVVDELDARGMHGAAEVFARTAPRHDTRSLPGYVAFRRNQEPDPAPRASLRAANEALASGRPDEALRAIDAAPRDRKNVVSVRLLYGRSLALHALERFGESARAFAVAADAAERLGWHARAASALYESGYNAYRDGDLRGALAASERQRRIEEARGNRPGMRRTLKNSAVLHERLGEIPRAAECLEAALRLVEEAKDRAGMASFCADLGGLYSRAGRPAKAFDFQMRALELFEEVGNPHAVAALRIDTGSTLCELGRFAEAREFFERGVKEAEATGHPDWVANALDGMADVHEHLGSKKRALEYRRDVLRMREEIEDRRGVAGALINMAGTLRALARLDEAREAYEKGLKLTRELGVRPWTANALVGLGFVDQDLGKYGRALERQEEALAIRRTLGDPSSLASSLGVIGSLHDDLGDYAKALDYLGRALALREELEDRVGIARTLTNLGTVHANLGNYPRALEHHRRALRIQRGTESPHDVATSLGNLGITHWRLGNYARSLECYEETLETFRALEDPVNVATTLSNLALVYDDLGDDEKALQLQEEALRVSEEMELRPLAAVALESLGAIHFARLDYARAQERYERSLGMRRDMGDRAGAVSALLSIGRVHARLGRPDEALGLYEKGLEEARELKHRPWIVNALVSIGTLHGNRAEYARARDRYEQALEVGEELGDRASLTRILGNLGKAHYHLGEDMEALRHARRAIEQLPLLLGGLSGDLSASAADDWTWIIDTGVRAGMRRDEPGEVAYFIESVSAGELRESLGGRDALRGADLPKALLEAEQEARAEVVRTRATLARTRAKGDREEILAAREARRAAEARFLEVVARIQREAKAVADVVHPKAATLTEIQRSLGADETLVSYALLYEEAVALVVTRDEARVVELGTRREMDDVAASLEWSAAREPWEKATAKARRALLDPLQLSDRTTRLLVAPSGSLAYVPFSVLAGRREVVLVPSGTTYGVLREEREKRGEKVLALGDPDYGEAPDERTVALMRSGAALGSLPGTQAEVRAVGDVTLLAGRATETTLAKALGEAERWRAVHLACHGLIRTDRPRLSSLAMTPDERSDGFLTVLEVFRMKVPADLVVLSACETARGKIYRAEGVVGFTRAFMMAGAPRVIVSLWKVDDAATRALMVRFYELWNPKDGKGLPAATALKRAQELVRDHPDHPEWKHPYFWAAWQLWGLPE